MFDVGYTKSKRLMELYKKYDYSVLSAGDVMSNMMADLQNGIWHLRMADGKFEKTTHHLEWSIPWIFAEKSPERTCILWNRIMFGKFGMLPIWCRLNCWKVVVRPRSLRELFLLKDIQEQLKVPSKLGIETRARVFGNFGGYFYTNSMEEGFDRLDQVKGMVKEHLSPRTPVHLKLACTEFEHSFGPTDQYKPPTDEEYRNEDTIRGCFVINPFDSLQPKHVRDHIGQKWIHFAWDRGDPTVKKFNSNKPLFPAVVTYERPKKSAGQKNKEETK